MEFGADHAPGASGPHMDFRGRQHTDERSSEIDPQGVPMMGGTADAKLRAGFMLMPEIGASIVI